MISRSDLVTAPAGRRTRWLFAAIWIILIAIAVPLAGKLADAESNDQASYLPTDAESTRALDLAAKFDDPNSALAVILYTRDSGITAADVATAKSDLAEIDRRNITIGLSRTTSGQQALGPIVSKDRKAMEVVVRVGNAGKPEFDDHVTDIRSIVKGSAKDSDGLRSYVTGPAGQAADSDKAFANIDGTLLLAAGVVVIVILLIVYRSPTLWIVPVLCAGISLEVAQGVIYLFARYGGLTVNGLSAGILDVMVFGAGTDYALLVIARYREELHRHEDKFEAMQLALRRTSPAIVASAVTVIIALLCLLFSELNSNVGLGSVAALGIGCTLLVMTTLLPALLVIVGRRVFWPFVPRYAPGTDALDVVEDTRWHRIGLAVKRHPTRIWISTALALGVLCIGLVSLSASGLSNSGQYPSPPESVRGQRIADQHFPAGTGTPVVIIGKQAAAPDLRRIVGGTKGIAGIQEVANAGGYTQIQAGLVDVPDSDAAYDTIGRLRDRLRSQAPAADAVVGGQTAVVHDVNVAAAHDRDLTIPLVLGVVFVILALLLRALVAPIVLMATVVLSFGAALGVSAFFIAHVFHFEGADPTFPLFAFIFLVALGIDYNIFLMTRVREEAAKRGTAEGVVVGVAVTGGVITSAGAVLAATFAVLALLPLVQLIEVGFAVAVGVLLDTLVVRSILVPALTIDLGRWVWWPSRLWRDGDPEPVEPSPVSPAGEA